jgi:hypothetical protein
MESGYDLAGLGRSSTAPVHGARRDDLDAVMQNRKMR